MELVSGKVWTERKIVVILNVTTIFALHEKRRKSSFRKSYMNTRFFYRKRNGMYFCSIVLKRKRKESFTMTMKNVKAQSAKALANVSLKLGKVSADSACCYIFHQPKVPKDLKKLKKI